MIRYLNKGVLFIILMALLAPCVTFAQSLSLTETTTDKSYAPQGTKSAIIYFKLKAVGGDASFTSLSFKNNSNAVFFGKKITKVYLYKDSGVLGTFEDGTESELDSITYGSVPNVSDQQFVISETISSGNSQGYFVVYDIAASAELGASTNITLQDINDSGFDFGSNDISNNLEITGFSSKEIVSVAPTVVLPGQTNVAMLKLTLQMSGEELNEGVTINVENTAGNFVMSSDKTNGITAAYLYKDTNNIGSFDPNFLSSYTLAKQVLAGNFQSSFNVAFSFPERNDINIGTITSTNFFVVYDIGEDFQVTDNTKITAQVTALGGIGSESRSQISLDDNLPLNPASSFVAGLSYDTDYVASLVRTSDRFGVNSTVPMMVFELRANQVAMNISTINIENKGTVPFITTSSDPKNIQKILLYEDTNRDGQFNGLSSGQDTKIADFQLGSGNQVDRAVVPLNSLQGNVLTINKFDTNEDENSGYNQNNAVRIFALYTFGQTIEASQVGVSPNIGKYSIARLENVVGTVNVSGNIYTVKLSGSKPLAASPESIVFLKSIDVIVNTSEIISPATAIQGQIQVPMLYLSLYSNNEFASSNVQLFNESSTYSPSNEGVSKIWLYRDNNNNKQLDSADSLLGSQSNPTNVSTASISTVPLFTGNNNWLVLYDIGINASTDSDIANIRAQLSNIQSSTGLTIGGQTFPFPTAAATLKARPKHLQISNVSMSTASTSTVQTNFDVSITVQNLTTASVTVLEVDPRFYLSVISGRDISYEFTTTSDTQVPFVLSSNESKTIIFSVTHATRVSDGIALIDPYVQYIVSDSIYPQSATAGVAELVRYKGGTQWFSTFSGTSPRVNISKSTPLVGWGFPAYVSSIAMVFNGNKVPFANYDAIPKQSELQISFVNQGKNLDENSFTVSINGAPLTKNQSISSSGMSSQAIKSLSNTYSYDSSLGVLTIQDVGSTGGSAIFSTTDVQGNSLDSLVAKFSISDRIKIENMYFYPNPYLRSASQPLMLGFSITQPATSVNVYLFNQVGQEVWHFQTSYDSIGYHTITILSNQEFVASGVYICKMYAQDANGNRVNAVTKLAIY